MYMTSAFNGVVHSMTSLPVLIRFRPIFYREKFSYTYSPSTYSFALALVEIPYIAASSCLFVISFYWLAGLRPDAAIFFKYLLAHCALSLCFSSWGQFLAAVCPNAMITNMAQGTSFTFMFLFGGVFIRASNIPVGWIWFYYIDPVPKALIALAMPQFDCPGYDQCDSSGVDCPCNFLSILGASGQTANTTTIAQFVSDSLSAGYDSYWEYLGWLALTYLVMRIMVFAAVSKVAHIKR